MIKISNKQNRISSDGNIHDAQRLKELQALPLERKIGITQARIMEFYREFDGKVYVSFSGGKDSTVLLDITRKLFPDVEAVFVDTGLEYPEIRCFVKTFDNVTCLRPEMNFRKVIEEYGYPIISKELSHSIESWIKQDELKKSKIHSSFRGEDFWGYESQKFNPDSDYVKKYGARFSFEKWAYLKNAGFKISGKCCNAMKKNPSKTFEKESNKKVILGTMASESLLRKTDWIRFGCNSFDSKRPTSKPISFWTDQDVLQYIKLNNLKISSVYGEIIEESGKLKTTRCSRTGCMFCMYGVQSEKEPNRFQRMRETHPKLYEYCIKDWEDGGLGLGKVLDYIGVNYK